MPEVWDEAKAQGVELIALPATEACELLRSIDEHPVNAILHVTCWPRCRARCADGPNLGCTRSQEPSTIGKG